MNRLMQLVKEKLESAGIADLQLEVPPNSEMGDFALPCFRYAKELKKSPADIAKDFQSKIKTDDIVKEAVAAGPYLNIFLHPDFKTKAILTSGIYDNKTKPETVMVEFVSPNTNKPLHLGHVRNMVLGESVSRIIEANGNKVIRSCLFNDKGAHICKSIIAYQKWGDGKEPDKKLDHFVGDFYVKFAKESENDPQLEVQAQDMLVKWENKDPETMKTWGLMNKWAFDGFNQTFESMGIKFDKFYYESEIYQKAINIVKDGKEKGIFVEDEKGNLYVDLEDYKMPNKIVLRADGTSVYITQDIYLAKLKFDEFDLSRSIYVVGSEQNLHFKQLFKMLELLGIEIYKKCEHLSYGMVYLPTGKMKSREGIVVDADDLVEDMKKLALSEVEKRYEDLGVNEKKSRAEMIGLGALKFFLLKNDSSKDMNFDPEESISFEGETGPYVQYSHARICSIIRKSGDEPSSDIDFGLLDKEEEQKIISLIGNYQDVLSDAQKKLKPSIICRYLLDLCQAFNEFYHKHKVLDVDEELMRSRLFLISKVRDIICKGLLALAIDSPEKM